MWPHDVQRCTRPHAGFGPPTTTCNTSFHPAHKGTPHVQWTTKKDLKTVCVFCFYERVAVHLHTEHVSHMGVTAGSPFVPWTRRWSRRASWSAWPSSEATGCSPGRAASEGWRTPPLEGKRHVFIFSPWKHVLCVYRHTTWCKAVQTYISGDWTYLFKSF